MILDVIVRALRARELPTTLLYGVDDLDPMDAQAMLTADATERWMGAPLATSPIRWGIATRRTHATSPRSSSIPSAGSASIRTATTG